jgi:5'-nucleotidase
MAIKKITILHSNDIHGDFLEEKSDEQLSSKHIGGLALLSAYVKKIRAEEKNVLFVVAGDMLQGSMIDTEYKGISTMEIMNYLSPDIVTLGNHEFDYGLPHLLFLEKIANFPIVNANLYIKGFGKRLMTPYKVITVDGFDILFTGIITESVINALKKDALIGSFVTLEDAAKEVDTICGAYKNSDIDLTVVLSHIGIESDRELASLINKKSGVDLIIGGHSHTFMEDAELVNNILIAQAGNGTNQIGRFDLEVDDETNSVVSYKWQLVPITEEIVSPDLELKELIQGFKSDVDQKYNAILTTFTAEATHPDRTIETTLGNIYADAFADIAKVDVVLLGSGCVRVEKLGPVVSLASFLSSFPYDDSFSKFTVNGAQLKKMFSRYMKNENRKGEGECYQINAGVCATYSTSQNKLLSLTVNGTEVSDKTKYTVALQGFHISSCSEFLDITVEELGAPYVVTTSAQEVLKEYLRVHQRIAPAISNRLKYVA